MLSLRVKGEKVRQEIHGYYLMDDKEEVTMHEMTNHFMKSIYEDGIIAPVNGKPTNLFPKDGRKFMEGLMYQFSGSYVRATKSYATLINQSDIIKISESISSYASAYDMFETLQETYSHFMPSGDQKTGVIGEFYSMLFLHKMYPESRIILGNTAQKGWDIVVFPNRQNRKYIQVKTVSEFSKSRRISPIHYGWDKLFLMYLNKNLSPIGFWIIGDKTIIKRGEILKGKTMPIPDKINTGSKIFEGKLDKLSVLISTLLR